MGHKTFEHAESQKTIGVNGVNEESRDQGYQTKGKLGKLQSRTSFHLRMNRWIERLLFRIPDGIFTSITPAALKTLRRKEYKKTILRLSQSQSRFFPLRLRVFA
jgi:hypothetical protein